MEEKRYWFAAKRYGWGWGLPLTWQGWAVLLGYFVLLAAGPLFGLAVRHPFAFGGYALLLTAALFAICWRTGEPPRWRGD